MKKHLLTGLSSLLFPMSMYGLPSNTGSYQRSYLRASASSGDAFKLSNAAHSITPATPLTENEDQIDINGGQQVLELVIIDAAVPEKHEIYKQSGPGIEIMELRAGESGLAQLKKILSGYRNLNALHIFSHAEDAKVYLGNSIVTKEVLSKDINTLAVMDEALKDGADVYFYGCNLAKTQEGESFLDLVSHAAKVDVAASNNYTGSHELGGDWNLEIQKGDINKQPRFDSVAMSDFNAILRFSGTLNLDDIPTGYANSKSYTIGGTSYTIRIQSGGSGPYVGNYSAGYVYLGSYGSDLTEASVYFTGGETFSLSSLYLFNSNGVSTKTFRITSNKGGVQDSEAVDTGSSTTVNFSGANWTDITSFTIQYTDNTTLNYVKMDDIVISDLGPPRDSDGSLTAAAGVSEPVDLDTTVDTVGEAVDVFDFTLADGGTADGLAMTASQIIAHVSGTSTDTERDQVTWRLNGPDVSNVTGTYNAGADTITFSGLSISVADGGNETYTINAYYNDITGLTDGRTIILSVDGDTDLTVGASGTQMGSTTAVNNGTGTTIEVEGNSLAFDGTDDTVVVADAAFPDLSDSWTIEAWVKPNTVAEHNTLFDIANGADSGIDLLILSGGRIEANTTSGESPETPSGIITADTWQHIALVADPTDADDKLRLYVNGTFVDFTTEDDSFTGGTFSGDFYIGSRNPGHGTPVWMDGNIDEVRVWNVARTEAEINASMSVEMATQPTPASLVAYYSMNGVGQTLADGSTAGTADAQRGTTAGNDAADPARSPDSPIFATNLTQTIGYTEGDASVALNDIVVSGPDGETITATLTLSNTAAGSLSTGTFGAATSTYNAGTGVWTVTGSVDDVNAALAATAFAPATNLDQNVTIATRIRDAADTGPADGAISLNVTPVNDSPTASNLTQTVAYTEDPGGSVALGDVVVTDVDTGDIITATFTSSNPAAGALTTGTFGSATSTYNAGTGVWTVTGSVSDVNAALAAVAFTPVTHWNQDITITTRIRDAADTGPADGTISLDVTAVNDAPTATNLTQTVAYTEDPGGSVALGDVVVTDAETDDTITAIFTSSNPAAGALTTGTFGSATSSYNAGTGVWTVTGSISDVNAALAAVAFTPAANFDQNFTLTTRIRDAADTGPADGTISLNVTAVNDAPTDIGLSDNSILQSATGAGAAVGTLSSTDIDSAGFTYTLVSDATAVPGTCAGDSGNASFQIDGSALETAAALAPGSYSICIQTSDGAAAYKKGFTISVTDDVGPAAPTIVVADTALAIGETSGVTITFSEAVTGFDNADLTVANGTLSAVSSADSGITWTATLTPAASETDATNVITLANTGVTDAVGNAGAGTTNSNNYSIDTERPTATLVVTDTALAAGETSPVTITFNEAVTGFTNADLTVANGTLSTISSADGGITWTATLTPAASITDATNVITLANTGVTDAAGNAGTGTTDSNNYVVDTQGPSVNSVTLPANGTYLVGQNLDFTVNYDENITVSGTPRLVLTIGATTRHANYISGSGNSALVFRYTVQAGDNDNDGIALNPALELNGGSLKDATDNNANLSLGTIGSLASVLVDTQAPSVDSVTLPANASYREGQNLDFTVNYDEAVTVNTAGGTPRLTLTVGATTRYADYVSGSGSTELVFRYTVQTNDTDADGISLNTTLDDNGGTLRDANGNNADTDLGAIGDLASVLVDTQAPSITSVTLPVNATYLLGENLDFTVDYDEAVTVTGTPRLALTIGTTARYANYTSGSGTSALVFRYTAQNGDSDGDGIELDPALDLNGGTLRDAAGNDAETDLGANDLSGVLVDALDTDGDGVSDIQEGIDGTDPNDPDDYRDVDAPVITAPADLVIDAIGLYTPVTLRQLLGLAANATDEQVQQAQAALATDNIDGADCCNTQPQGVNNGRVLLPPGQTQIVWQGSDRKGNSGQAIQNVNIRPLVSVGKDQTGVEGSPVSFRVLLNGASPFYPLEVPFTIDTAAGSTDNTDHDLVDGTVTFNAGETQASVTINLTDDGIAEGDEILVLRLDDLTDDSEDLAGGYDPSNINDINSGAVTQQTVTITEGNVAPAVALSMQQNAANVIIVANNGGNVTVTANVTDPNAGDTHSYDWSGTGSQLSDTDGDVTDATFVFDPALLSAGGHTMQVAVTDSGNETVTRLLHFRVVAEAPALDPLNDTDGDGIDDQTEGVADSDNDGIPDYLDNIAANNVLPETAAVTDTYLIECEPGVRCRLGSSALLGSDGGARITADDFPADTLYTNVGGLFDFEVHELPVAGQTARVVIPQIAAIPADAAYRKFASDQWVTFVEDANNALHSAPGEAGFCPPPGDASWEPGLVEGYLCVQVTIEDGGANDADGLANGSVEDPGGVGQPVAVNPPPPSGSSWTISGSTKGGGGALGLPAGLTLLLLVLLRNGRRAAKVCGLLAALLASAAQAQEGETPAADEAAVESPTETGETPEAAMESPAETGETPSRWQRLLDGFAEKGYLTLGLYQAEGDQSRGDFVSGMANDGVTVAVQQYDVSRSAYQLSLGYRYLPGMAVEFGYLDLGDVDFAFTAVAPNAAALSSALSKHLPISSDGWVLANRFDYMFGNWRTSADLGLYFWDGKAVIDNPAIDASIKDGTDPLLGLQVAYPLPAQLELSLQYRRILFDDQDVELWGGALSWSF